MPVHCRSDSSATLGPIPRGRQGSRGLPCVNARQVLIQFELTTLRLHVKYSGNKLLNKLMGNKSVDRRFVDSYSLHCRIKLASQTLDEVRKRFRQSNLSL